MQPKISDFFNLRVPPPKTPIQQPQILHQIFDRKTQDPRYPAVSIEMLVNILRTKEESVECTPIPSRILKKKRSYAQLHLDLGQSDFLLHTCSICGFMYACGHEGDEKVHKDYTHGMQFKGWHNERVVNLPSTTAGRVILVLDGDPTAHKKKCSSNGDASQHTKEKSKECTPIPSRILEKKRSYAQLHLDLGQSDFLLHPCSICGFMYACGYEGDEKVHKEFHKDYTHGIPFKGWNNEMVVNLPSTTDGRIILVLDGDPTAHKKKVYLYILQKRIAGCLVAEPVKTAYRVLSNSEAPESIKGSNANKNGSNSSKLQFGGTIFQREAMKRAPSAINPAALEEELMGALILGNEAVPAICGIRGIWVAPAMRRKQIASQLLDAVRVSFCEGFVLKSYRLAFSDPTSSGMALACSYFNTTSFLAYKTD